MKEFVFDSRTYWSWHTFFLVIALEVFQRVMPYLGLTSGPAIRREARQILPRLRKELESSASSDEDIASLLRAMFDNLQHAVGERESDDLIELATRDSDESENGWLWTMLLRRLLDAGGVLSDERELKLPSERIGQLHKLAAKHLRALPPESTDDELLESFPADRDYVEKFTLPGGDRVYVSGQIADMTSWRFWRLLWSDLLREFQEAELREIHRWARMQAAGLGIPQDLIRLPIPDIDQH